MDFGMRIYGIACAAQALAPHVALSILIYCVEHKSLYMVD
ncbi:hypothetical protein D1AOALGA4SA_10101 [Olavius algarvensis Delta 1 endosymbiont]|nr:hypothetical protein D1AOALGA4SA_10101 [Olavius algarvensis Delta 1 endosymbiont]